MIVQGREMQVQWMIVVVTATAMMLGGGDVA
jgi:hypothetical protein